MVTKKEKEPKPVELVLCPYCGQGYTGVRLLQRHMKTCESRKNAVLYRVSLSLRLDGKGHIKSTWLGRVTQTCTEQEANRHLESPEAGIENDRMYSFAFTRSKCQDNLNTVRLRVKNRLVKLLDDRCFILAGVAPETLPVTWHPKEAPEWNKTN